MSASNASTAASPLAVVHLDQAVFTSARTRRSNGYQLISRSPGVTPADCLALTRWGPSHDSLIDGADRSVNFFPLPSGAYCLSLTTASGAEHSGRRGARHYTHCLICSPTHLAVVDNDPWAIVAAVFRDGRPNVDNPIPERLDPLEVRLDADTTWPVGEISDPLPRAIYNSNCVIVGAVDGESLVAAVIGALPPELRLMCSFATALRYSPRRPFRLMCLGEDPQLCRRLSRQGHQVFDHSAND